MLLEVGIFASHGIWRLRTRKLHQRAKALKVPFDSLEETEKYRQPVLRRSSIAFSRGMSDGTLGQYHRRASLVEALADPERRATIDESRRSTLAKVRTKDSTAMGGAVVIEEDEVSADESTGAGPQPNSAGTDVERQGDYGTMKAGEHEESSKNKKRKPPPGRGESYFKEMNWR